MSEDSCPHCGEPLPGVRDAFCGICGEALDEPPPQPRSEEEKKAVRNRIEQNASSAVGLFSWFFRLFGR